MRHLKLGSNFVVSVGNGCSLRKLLSVRVTLALERQIGQMVIICTPSSRRRLG